MSCHRLVSEWLLGTSAVLAYHLGKTDTARMIADLSSAEVRLWNTEYDHEGYRIVLVVEPSLYPACTRRSWRALPRWCETCCGGRASPLMRSSPDRRSLASARTGAGRSRLPTAPGPSNQGRKVQLEPGHPVEDQLGTRRLPVLRERHDWLPNSETIGIVPLGGMRVRGWTFEPDRLITDRGYAGVIEIDGPQHKGHAGRNHSRTQTLPEPPRDTRRPPPRATLNSRAAQST